MPTPMPISTISPPNRLFGSARINANGDGFDTSRLNSTYYMSPNANFVRLRPLHRDGFAILRSQGRVVGMYAGAWDSAQSFDWNENNNLQIVFRRLGDSAAAISAAIGVLKGQTMTTAQILQHNANPQNNLANSVVYVDQGGLEGSFFGGDQNITNNLYQSMGVVDAPDPGSNAHRGDVMITPQAAQSYYDTYYPGLLTQLMQLGLGPQSIAINLAPKGRAQTMEIKTNLQYFAQNMFENRGEQSAFIRAMIMSFV